MHNAISFLRNAIMTSLLAMGTMGNAHSAPVSSTTSHEMTPAAASTLPPSGVYYEIFVRAFADSNGDGIGDLNGLTAKLDYLKSLGVSGLWLMPINPTPSYHGYDVTDYYGINPQYGTAADFQRLLSEAHKRGISVIIDLVINHTSDQHPWFTAAADPKNPKHDWYSWSTATTDLGAISATDTPAWHALGSRTIMTAWIRTFPLLRAPPASPAPRRPQARASSRWACATWDRSPRPPAAPSRGTWPAQAGRAGA